MEQVSVWFQFGSNLLDYFIMLYYFELVGKRRNTNKILFFLASLLYVVAITVVNCEGNSSWLNLCTFILGVSCISVFYSQDIKFGNMLIYDAMYVAMCVAVEIIALYVIQLLLKSTNLEIAINYICTMVIEKIVLLFAVYILLRNKKNKQRILQKETLLLLCVCTIMSAWIVVALADKLDTYRGWHESLYMGATLGCVCMELFLYFLIDRFQTMYKKILENQQIRYELEKQEEYLKVVEEKEQEIRVIRHDLKNQLLELKAQLKEKELEQNDTYSHEQAAQFVKSMIQALENEKVYTANRAVNIVLKEKIREAKQRGISVTHEIHISDKFCLDMGDMGVILGNLLDNAIEASEKVEKPFIDINIRQRRENIFICIKNRMCADGNKDLSTTKKDKVNHGFGLKSVRKLTQKYNGFLQIYEEEDVFVVELILAEKNENCKNMEQDFSNN